MQNCKCNGGYRLAWTSVSKNLTCIQVPAVNRTVSFSHICCSENVDSPHICRLPIQNCMRVSRIFSETGRYDSMFSSKPSCFLIADPSVLSSFLNLHPSPSACRWKHSRSITWGKSSLNTLHCTSARMFLESNNFPCMGNLGFIKHGPKGIYVIAERKCFCVIPRLQ